LRGEGAFDDTEVVVDGAGGLLVRRYQGLSDDEGELGVRLGERHDVDFKGGLEGDEEGAVLEGEDGGRLVHSVVLISRVEVMDSRKSKLTRHCSRQLLAPIR